MSNHLYNALTWLAMPVIRRGLKRRFGPHYVRQRMDVDDVPSGSYDLLIHAASVGEQQLVRPVIAGLAEQDRRMLLTAATDTGLARAMKTAEEAGVVRTAYMPLDRPGPMKRFFERISADKLVLVETEIWPNLIQLAATQGVRIVLINGRLSDASFRNYRRFRFLFSSAFRSIDHCLVRSSEDGSRFRELGFPRTG